MEEGYQQARYRLEDVELKITESATSSDRQEEQGQGGLSGGFSPPLTPSEAKLAEYLDKLRANMTSFACSNRSLSRKYEGGSRGNRKSSSYSSSKGKAGSSPTPTSYPTPSQLVGLNKELFGAQLQMRTAER